MQGDERKRATGLRYDADGQAAPRVVAQGVGETARRILDVAEKHGVPVRRDPDLLQLLGVVRLGDEIPVEVFDAVARLLAFLYDLNSKQERT